MEWTMLMQAMMRAGFSPGESVIMALVVVAMVQHALTLHRLKVRSTQASADRARLWKALQDERVAAALAISTHERKFHRDDPQPA